MSEKEHIAIINGHGNPSLHDPYPYSWKT